MSDECAYCGGRGAGCHPAGVRPDSPAPLSPIALDFAEAERDARRHCGLGDFQLATADSEKATRHNLNAQLRALVARVAQEEREKVFKEVMAEWTKPTIRTHAEAYQYVSDFTCWLQGKISRGTP